MATSKSQTISTLGECLQAMARYAGGSVPATTDTKYDDWVRSIQLGQEDAAKRGFWGRLLTKDDLAITANADTALLPDDFHKRNGIFVLEVDGEDWNDPANESGQVLHVETRPADAKWLVRFTGYTPTASATGTLWYFYNPPVPEDESDPLYLDGEMIMFYALTEHFRAKKQFGSLDDARLEYNNRFSELIGLEMLPSPHELLSWKPFNTYLNHPRTENIYYSRTRRSRR
jgi:hypothetical protein